MEKSVKSCQKHLWYRTFAGSLFWLCRNIRAQFWRRMVLWRLKTWGCYSLGGAVRDLEGRGGLSGNGGRGLWGLEKKVFLLSAQWGWVRVFDVGTQLGGCLVGILQHENVAFQKSIELILFFSFPIKYFSLKNNSGALGKCGLAKKQEQETPPTIHPETQKRPWKILVYNFS